MNAPARGATTRGRAPPHGPRPVASDRRSVPTWRYTPSTRNVYTRCVSRVRTNIEIEDTFLQTVMDRYGLRTKTEAVDFALRHLAGQPMTRDEALAMRGARAIGKVPADTRPPTS